MTGDILKRKYPVLVQYQTLPRQQRRAAQKLAKQLLRTTLPVPTEGRFGQNIRGALSTAYMKPENVVAVFTYDDGNGNWWGDVVLRKGQGTYQIGVAEESPYGSRAEALAHVERLIGKIKAMREDPLVAVFRQNGIDVESIEMLRVRHKQFGWRFIVRHIDTIGSEADQFAERHGIADNVDPTVFYYAEQAARAIVLYYAPEFTDGENQFLSPPAATDKCEDEIALWREAASFLLARGIGNVDDQTELDVEYERVSIIPDQNAKHPVGVLRHRLRDAVVN
jgi:hypothetical protein